MLDAEEIARRREAYRQARACNRIEGIPHDPATDPIFEALILGEIDSEEALAAIKALPIGGFDGRIHLGKIGTAPPDLNAAPQRPDTGSDDTEDSGD